ncbi:MAG: hypothetical protein HY548_05560, partial [Elusimicrobia bacterium]|nr:hypothetical protein [Elusimicrobiota bacterium]
QDGVIDGSHTFNVAMILLMDGSLRGSGYRGEFKLDLNRIRISDSHAEATLSQIFSRSVDGSALTFGGSATLDVARDIAKVIFNAEAVDLQSSSYANDYGKENTAGKLPPEIVNAATREAQLESAMKRVRPETLKDRGVLLGVNDVAKARELFFRILEEYGAKDVDGYRAEVEGNHLSLRQALTLARDRGYAVADRIEVIDGSSSSHPSAERVAETAGQLLDAQGKTVRAGKIVISNMSGLRAISYDGIMDMVVFDAHRMTYGELLQALGRVERSYDVKEKAAVNKEYQSSRLLLIDSADLNFLYHEMLNVDLDFVKRGVAEGMFATRPETRTMFEEVKKALGDAVSPEKLTEEVKHKLLQVATEYKTLREKSESTQFKASIETLTKLLKEPLASMRALDPELIARMEKQILENEERFSTEQGTGELADPERISMITLLQAMNTAETFWAEVADRTSSRFLRGEAKLRLGELARTRGELDTIFQESSAQIDKTYAATPESVYDRPSRHIAEVAASLSRSVMPVETVGRTRQLLLDGTSMTIAAAKAALKDAKVSDGAIEKFEKALTGKSQVVGARSQVLSIGRQGDLTYAGQSLSLAADQIRGLSDDQKAALNFVVEKLGGLTDAASADWAAEAAVTLYLNGALPVTNFKTDTVALLADVSGGLRMLSEVRETSPSEAEILRVLRSPDSAYQLAKAVTAVRNYPSRKQNTVAFFRSVVTHRERLAQPTYKPKGVFGYARQIPSLTMRTWSELRMSSLAAGKRPFAIATMFRVQEKLDTSAATALLGLAQNLYENRSTNTDRKVDAAKFRANAAAMVKLLSALTPETAGALSKRLALREMWEGETTPDYSQPQKLKEYLTAKTNDLPFAWKIVQIVSGIGIYKAAGLVLGAVLAGAPMLIAIAVPAAVTALAGFILSKTLNAIFQKPLRNDEILKNIIDPKGNAQEVPASAENSQPSADDAEAADKPAPKVLAPSSDQRKKPAAPIRIMSAARRVNLNVGSGAATPKSEDLVLGEKIGSDIDSSVQAAEETERVTSIFGKNLRAHLWAAPVLEPVFQLPMFLPLMLGAVMPFFALVFLTIGLVGVQTLIFARAHSAKSKRLYIAKAGLVFALMMALPTMLFGMSAGNLMAGYLLNSVVHFAHNAAVAEPAWVPTLRKILPADSTVASFLSLDGLAVWLTALRTSLDAIRRRFVIPTVRQYAVDFAEILTSEKDERFMAGLAVGEAKRREHVYSLAYADDGELAFNDLSQDGIVLDGSGRNVNVNRYGPAHIATEFEDAVAVAGEVAKKGLIAHTHAFDPAKPYPQPSSTDLSMRKGAILAVDPENNIYATFYEVLSSNKKEPERVRLYNSSSIPGSRPTERVTPLSGSIQEGIRSGERLPKMFRGNVTMVPAIVWAILPFFYGKESTLPSALRKAGTSLEELESVHEKIFRSASGPAEYIEMSVAFYLERNPALLEPAYARDLPANEGLRQLLVRNKADEILNALKMNDASGLGRRAEQRFEEVRQTVEAFDGRVAVHLEGCIERGTLRGDVGFAKEILPVFKQGKFGRLSRGQQAQALGLISKNVLSPMYAGYLGMDPTELEGMEIDVRIEDELPGSLTTLLGRKIPLKHGKSMIWGRTGFRDGKPVSSFEIVITPSVVEEGWALADMATALAHELAHAFVVKKYGIPLSQKGLDETDRAEVEAKVSILMREAVLPTTLS